MRDRLTSLVQSQKYWLITFSVFAFSRLATILYPFDSDHWIFYYIGRRWLDGDILYLQAWDHKSPLIFAINAAMHATLGGNIVLHRIFLGIVAALTLWVFYITAKRFFKYIGRTSEVIDARVATLFFAFWGSLSQFTNSGNNTENFGILALLLAVYFYLRWRQSLMWKWLVYSGAAISCLIFLKINFSILALPLLVDFWILYRKNLRRLFFYFGLWAIPTIVQAVLWLSYFMPRNLVREFIIAMISFNGKYLRAGWAGNLSGQFIFVAILSVGFLAFIGAYYLLLKNRRHEKPLLVASGAAALLFSGILGTFYNHYYLVVIPYFCILLGAYWRQLLRNKYWLSLIIVGMVLSFGVSTKQLYNTFYGSVASDATNIGAAADYVREHTTPTDKVIFYGYGATFYRLSERDSGSRYISASHPYIDEHNGFGYDFTGKYIGDMAISKPKYVVFDESTLDIYDKNTRAMNYFIRHYELEVDMTGYEIWKIKK